MGKRGPKKTPAAVKKARGTFRKDRDTGPEPPPGMPRCPDFLTETAKELWPVLGKQLLERGLLTLQDQLSFALLCQAWADWKQAVEEQVFDGLTAIGSSGAPYQHPSVGIKNRAWLNVLRACQEFGLTPSARTGSGAGGDNNGSGKFTAAEKHILGLD